MSYTLTPDQKAVERAKAETAMARAAERLADGSWSQSQFNEAARANQIFDQDTIVTYTADRQREATIPAGLRAGLEHYTVRGQPVQPPAGTIKVTVPLTSCGR